MRRRRSPWSSAAWRILCLCGGASACFPRGPAATASLAPVSTDVRELPSRPPVAVVVRDGDPRAGFAVAVLTAGVDDAAGAQVPVALAAVAEARLVAAGFRDVTVAAAWDGYRVRAVLPREAMRSLVRAAREALLTPIPSSGPDVDAALARLAALARRPIPDPALAEATRCADGPLALAHPDGPPSAATLERWRAASDGLGRVVFGVAGVARDVDAVTEAVMGQPAWPAARVKLSVAPAPSEASRVYDASPEVVAGGERITVLVHTRDPDVAIAAARPLGDAEGPLAVRLRGLDPPVALRDVTATAHAAGGCLALTLETAREDARSEGHPFDEAGSVTLATAAAVARQEAGLGVTAATRTGTRVKSAALADDPRDAAELAAWWALVREASPAGVDGLRESVIVGLGGGGDAFATRAKAVADELERTFTAWEANVVDARTVVEQGQGEISILLASPCGPLLEGDSDAGLTALAVSALAEQARSGGRARDVNVSEWITTEGAGLLVRAAPRDGESSRVLAQRAADAVGAALMAGPLEASSIARARAELMAIAGRDDESRSFQTLAEALTPGHPSWTFPLMNGRELLDWSDGAVVSRVSALRRGPLRAAILGNDDREQVALAIRAVDRWVTHSASASRSCPLGAPPPAARAGTYAAPPATTSSAWIAVPLRRAASSGATSVDSVTPLAARAVAAALDGPDGLLAGALSSGLAYSWSAKVVGPRDAAAIVIHVGAASHTLDAAVAQVRALLDRLRGGAFTDADRARASAWLEREDLAASLTARGRLAHLWLGDAGGSALPSTAGVRAFLADTVRDDGLVIVASRPPLARTLP